MIEIYVFVWKSNQIFPPNDVFHSVYSWPPRWQTRHRSSPILSYTCGLASLRPSLTLQYMHIPYVPRPRSERNKNTLPRYIRSIFRPFGRSLCISRCIIVQSKHHDSLLGPVKIHTNTNARSYPITYIYVAVSACVANTTVGARIYRIHIRRLEGMHCVSSNTIADIISLHTQTFHLTKKPYIYGIHSTHSTQTNVYAIRLVYYQSSRHFAISLSISLHFTFQFYREICVPLFFSFVFLVMVFGSSAWKQ